MLAGVCVGVRACELPLLTFYVRSFNNIYAKHEISGFHSVKVRILVFWTGTLSSRVTGFRRCEGTSESINLTALTTQKTRTPCTLMFSISQVRLQLLCEVNKHLLAANEGCIYLRLRNWREANHTWLYKTLCRLIWITIWCSIRVFEPPSPISITGRNCLSPSHLSTFSTPNFIKISSSPTQTIQSHG
jgi:hypothetical protein